MASLVVPADPPAQVTVAAEHLARRVEEACGVAPPVVNADTFSGGPALWFGGGGGRSADTRAE